MKQLITLSVLSLLIMTACNNHGGTGENSNKDSAAPKPTATPAASPSIIGGWVNKTNDGTGMEFKKDSVYFIDGEKTFKYEVFGDSLVIHMSPDMGVKYAVTNDTILTVGSDTYIKAK